MANEYAVNQTDLAAVADAIRAKGGTSDALTFPGGFVDAVGAIQAGGGDSQELLVSIATNALSELNTASITKLTSQAFRTLSSIKKVNLPNCNYFAQDAFNGNKGVQEIYLENYTGTNGDGGNQLFFANCTALTKAYMPKCVRLQKQMFNGDVSLTDLTISDSISVLDGTCLKGTAITEFVYPTVTQMYNNVFENCPNLTKVDINNSGWKVEGAACKNAASLETFIMRSAKLISLLGTGAFAGTPIESGTGYIYVPSALVEDYKVATNWATYADQIRAIEDYPEITGG